MEFIKINDVAIKSPTEITISPETLDKVERTVDGTMVVDIIASKRKVDIAWEYLSKEDMTTLVRQVGNDKFATISFHDNNTGELVSMVARVEGLTYKPYYDWTKSKLMWKSVSISFLER